MNPQQRFLCSQLVELRHNFADPAAVSIVNLEEIWRTGAILESETAVTEGAEIELHCGAAFFAGRIVDVEPHEFGWRFEIEFSVETPLDSREFQPEHLLDPSALGWKD